MTQGDLVRHSRRGASSTAGTVATDDVIAVTSETTVYEASQQLVHEDVRQLLVIDDGELVGIFGRLDALRVSELEHQREASQPGWLTRSAFWRKARQQAPD